MLLQLPETLSSKSKTNGGDLIGSCPQEELPQREKEEDCAGGISDMI